MPVAARFHDLRDKVLAAVDFAFAEPVRLSFMSKGVVDTARPLIEIEAVLRTGESSTRSVSERSPGNWRSRVAAGKAQLHIDRATYTGPAIRQGDKVKALALPGQPWFEVSDVDDRSHVRLIVNLTEG